MSNAHDRTRLLMVYPDMYIPRRDVCSDDDNKEVVVRAILSIHK